MFCCLRPAAAGRVAPDVPADGPSPSPSASAGHAPQQPPQQSSSPPKFDVIPKLSASDEQAGDQVIRRPRKPSLTLEDGIDLLAEKRKASSFGQEIEANIAPGGRFSTKTRRRSSSWGPGDFTWSESGGLREASFSMKRHNRPPKLAGTKNLAHSVFAAASVISPTEEHPENIPE